MPLVAVALLWLVVALPKTMARMALAGAAGGGGFASRTASRVAARRVDSAVTQTTSTMRGRDGLLLPADGLDIADSRAGATARQPGEHAAVGGAQQRERAATAAGEATGVGAAATAEAGVGAAAAQRVASQAPEGLVATGGQQPAASPGRGLRNPSWHEIRNHVPAELTAAARRSADTTRADVAGAMGALAPAARQGVIDLMNSHGGQIRGQMAHQAARGELEASEREAFRTLAAASSEVRAHGISDFAEGAGAEPVAAPSTSAGATDRGAGPDSTGRRVDAAGAAPSGLGEGDGASSIPPARGGNGSSPEGGAR
jgi:hypothetical protein